MILSMKKIISLVIFIIAYLGLVLSFFTTNFFTGITEHSQILDFIITGQKLTFNLSISLSIIFWGFSNEYLNIFMLARFKDKEDISNYILKKSLFISGFVAFNAILLQIILFYIYRFNFVIMEVIKSFVIVFIFSFSSFYLYNALYLKKIKNSLCIAIFFISRATLFIIVSSFGFVNLKLNVNLIIYIYIIIELIVTSIINYILLKDMETLVL